MTITPDTIRTGATLAARSNAGPLIVNRYDGDDGSINWQLQQEGCSPESEDGAEVICAVSDRDWKNARQTAEFFRWCAAHAGGLCAEVATLRAECARLGVEACDAKWSLTP